ncbi:type III secretion effector protein [Pseudomonas sp. HN11]|uniref:type III secretion effector protein n=1 Tax=Pseudomonas sp. HN11 TaxID=1344094 RepID=UPI001F1BC006|nr:type III secretion effector protein [Pseudomonas sp. HN11]UII73404.1 type III secretion effector protein [Pseudomonas sp. HN11]
MSVSTLDSSPSASSTREFAPTSPKPQAKASDSALAAPSFSGQSPARVSFSSRESQAGPVFGDAQAQTDRSSLQHAAVLPGVMDKLKHWMGNWFGGHRPPMHSGCNNPPPRPNPGWSNPPPRPMPTLGRPHPTQPGRPDPHYSLKNNEQLAQQLLDNFDAFRDPKNPGYVSVDSIHAMANRGWSSDPVMNENIRLAKELLRRPKLIDAADRHSTTGALDGLIDRQKLGMIIRGDNYFKYASDKQLVQEMLDHFKELKGGQWGPYLRVKDLERLAARPLTGDSARDHLTQLAQEFLKRSDLVEEMADWFGRIRWKTLNSASL